MYRKPPLFIITFCFVVINLAKSSTLYDVTFSAPEYTAGQPSLTGLGSSTPSLNIFGTSTVATNVGGHDQSLLLEPQNLGSFIYSQYEFLTPLPANQKYLRTSFDIFVENLAPPVGQIFGRGPDDGFTLLFDTPSVVALDFTGSGSILENSNDIGQFTYGAWNTMTIDIDFTTNSWSIFENGLLLANTTFFYPYPANPGIPTSVDSIRMNLADNISIPGTPKVYLDNILIASSDTAFATASVPESLSLAESAAFLVLGVMVAKTVRKRRRAATT